MAARAGVGIRSSGIGGPGIHRCARTKDPGGTRWFCRRFGKDQNRLEGEHRENDALLGRRAFIKNWIAKNPTKAAYRFRYYVDLDENFKGRVRTDGAAYDDKLKFRPHNYKLIVYNANDIEVKGLTIRWEVYLNDVVDTVGNAYTKLALGYKKQDKLQTLAGKVVDKSLDLKGKIEINHGFILQDYVDRDGGRVDQAARDNVIGIRARIYKDDELIDEFEDGEDDGRFKDASWQDAECEAPIEDSSE